MESDDKAFPPTHVKILQCKNCFRYQNVDSQWIPIPFESPDFINFCVSCLEAQNSNDEFPNHSIVRANLIHSSATSHSFSISIELADSDNSHNRRIQKIIWFNIEDTVCSFCQNALSSNQIQQWSASIIISAFSDRLNPLKWLQNEIENKFSLKTIPPENINNCNVCDNLKLFYHLPSKSTAFRIVSFIKKSIAVNIEETIEKIPRNDYSDINNILSDNYDLNITYNVSLPGIWSDDLVNLPESVCLLKGSGNICICKNVKESILFIDPETGIQTEIKAEMYWKDPFPALVTKSTMVLFNISDVTPFGPKIGRVQMCDLEINRIIANSDIIKKKNMGIKQFSSTMFVKSHLGNELRPGDCCLGYDLRNGFSSFAEDAIVCPDAIVVRKVENLILSAFLKEKAEDNERMTTDRASEEEYSLENNEDKEATVELNSRFAKLVV